MVSKYVIFSILLMPSLPLFASAQKARPDLSPWSASGRGGKKILKGPEKPAGPFLPTGSLIRASTVGAIYSLNLDTPVVAELDEEAGFGGKVVFPRRTRLLGRALVVKSHDRVNIMFDRAVLPDGKEIEIQGIALAPDGSSGIPGRVEKVHDSAVASAALKGAVMGAASVAAQAANPVAAQASQSVANETINEIDLGAQSVDTSISVPAFTRCLIYLSRRVEVEPPPTKETPHESKR